MDMQQKETERQHRDSRKRYRTQDRNFEDLGEARKRSEWVWERNIFRERWAGDDEE